jgi:hypothetical protein
MEVQSEISEIKDADVVGQNLPIVRSFCALFENTYE